MTDIQGYQVALELYHQNGTALAREAVAVDWEPAIESAWFDGVRGDLLPLAGTPPAAAIRPVWHSRLGEPYLAGFTVELSVGGEKRSESQFTTIYFAALAEALSTRLVAAGKLVAGEQFSYFSTAFAAPQAAGTRRQPRFSAVPLAAPLTLRETSLEPLLRVSSAEDEQRTDDMTAFVADQVLAQTTDLTRRSGDNETGGILVGHLCRDSERQALFAVVSAQIPATRTNAASTSLTFTSATWTDVRAALDLRRKGEIMLGWWHSHPVRSWCASCPDEKRRSCSAMSCFFSTQDEALHRTVFPKAFSLALVVSEITEDDRRIALFGWRRGRVEQRGFHIKPASAGDGLW